jgi:hypothetical protein
LIDKCTKEKLIINVGRVVQVEECNEAEDEKKYGINANFI